MRKVLCLALVLLLVFSFAACKEEGNKTNGDLGEQIVDKKTVELVNNAFAETEKVLKEVTALGLKRNVVLNVTAEGKTVSTRSGVECEFVKDGTTLKVASETAMTSDLMDMKAVYYSDGTTTYASTADTTYLITANDALKEYLNGLIAINEKDDIFNSSSIEPINTKIVNTSEKGYGFILDYPTDKMPDDFNNFFGESLKQFGDTTKPTGLRVSGIIDEKGRLTAETVTYTFTYEYEVEVESEEDPDNETADTEPKKEKRTATVEISAQMSFEYGITEIDQPDEIEIPATENEDDKDDDKDDDDKDDDKKPQKLKELSISDFNKLVAENAVKDAVNNTESEK